MKKNYNQPKLVIEFLSIQDVMVASSDDNKFVSDAWSWDGGMY